MSTRQTVGVGQMVGGCLVLLVVAGLVVGGCTAAFMYVTADPDSPTAAPRPRVTARPAPTRPAPTRPAPTRPAPTRPAPVRDAVVLTTMDRDCLHWTLLVGVEPPMSQATIRANYADWKRDVLPRCMVLAEGARELCALMDEAGMDPFDELDLATMVLLYAPDTDYDRVLASVLTWCDR